MRKLIFSVIGILLCLPGIARAEQDDLAARKAAAEHMLEAMNYRQVMEQMLPGMLDMQVKGMAALPCAAQMEPDMRAFFIRYINYDAFKPDIINGYVQFFTLAEIKEITAFYSTPTGQKILREMPELMKQSMQAGIARVQQHKDEIAGIVHSHRNPDGSCIPSKQS